MRFYQLANILIALTATFLWSGTAQAQVIKLASTTSADNSGLYDYILPEFTEQTGLRVDVIAVGTGRAINLASRGDADALIVHDKDSELAFVAAGYGIDRRTFMYNDYVLVGPDNDPAGIADSNDILQALQSIAQSGVRFVSRGDDSGTHKKELSLWMTAGVDVTAARQWYLEVGGGMGQALNIANQIGAYTLSDRSTWLSFNNKDNMRLLVENHPALTNPYSIILVNPERHPGINYAGAKAFADWITSPAGLELIATFKVAGVQLFKVY